MGQVRWLLLSGSKRSVLKRQSRNMIDDCYEYRRRVDRV